MTMYKRFQSSHSVSRALPAAPTAAATMDAWFELPLPVCLVRVVCDMSEENANG